MLNLVNLAEVLREAGQLRFRFRLVGTTQTAVAGRKFIDTERIYFPLAGDGETVDMLLIVNGYPGNPEFMPRAGLFPTSPPGPTPTSRRPP